MENMQVTLMAAVSADGFIAQTATQRSTNWTSKEDKKFFVQKSQEIGTLVMGSTTFATIGSPLPKRLNIIYTRQNRENFLTKFNLNTARITSDILRVTQEEPAQLLKQLAAEGIEKVLIAGGSSIYSLFMQAELVDEIILTIEPVIFGQGITLFSEEQFTELDLLNSQKINPRGTLVNTYKIRKLENES